MAKKRTLICIHVMPTEIEMFERLMHQMKKALMYLDDNDDVTLKVTLNLNDTINLRSKPSVGINYTIPPIHHVK